MCKAWPHFLCGRVCKIRAGLVSWSHVAQTRELNHELHACLPLILQTRRESPLYNCFESPESKEITAVLYFLTLSGHEPDNF